MNEIQIKTEIEELEKRISVLSKKVAQGGNSAELTSQIATIQTNLESLQNELNGIDLSSIESDVNTLNSDLSSMQLTLNNVQENVISATNLATSMQSQVQSNTTAISTNANSIQTNTSQITTNRTNISNLTTRVQNVENNVSILTGGIDYSAELNSVNDRLNELDGDFAQTCGDRMEYNQSLYCDNMQFSKTQRFVFACSPNQIIKMKLKMSFITKSTQQITTQCNLLLNEEVYQSFEYTFTTSATFNEDIIFYTDKKINNLKLEIKTSKESLLTKFIIDALGSNLVFLSNNTDVHFSCFDQQYYLCKNDGYTLSYDIIPKSNLSLNLSNSNNIGMYRYAYCYIPFAQLNLNNNKCSSVSSINFLSMNSFKYSIKTANLSLSYDNNAEILIANGCGEYCYGNKAKIFYVDTNFALHITNFDNNIIKQNDAVLYEFIEGIPIINRRLNLNDDIYNFAYFIALKTDGYYYLFKIDNSFNITQSLKLYKGRFATAYLESDNQTINMYFNKGYSIYKVVLQYDENQNFYYVYSCAKYCNGYQLQEGLDGVCFITKTNNSEIVYNN